MPTFEAKLSPSEDCTSSPPPLPSPSSPSSPSPTHQPIYHHHRCNIIKTSGSSSSNALLRTLASTHCYYFYYYRRIFVQPLFTTLHQLYLHPLYFPTRRLHRILLNHATYLWDVSDFSSPSLFFGWSKIEALFYTHFFCSTSTAGPIYFFPLPKL